MYQIIQAVYAYYPIRTEQELINFLSSETTKVVAVLENEVIQGFGFLEIENNHYGSITGIVAGPNARGGIGNEINNRLVKLAKSLGIKILQTDPVLNHQDGDTQFSNQHYSPNLANLAISTKLGGQIVGYDILRYIALTEDSQDARPASVARMVINLEGNLQLDLEIQSANTQLQIYLNQNFSLPSFFSDGNLKLEAKSRGEHDGDAIIASSTNLADFRKTSFIPCYFLPSYKQDGETTYFGIYYSSIRKQKPDNSLTKTMHGLNIDGEKGISGIVNTDLLKALLENIYKNYYN